MQFNYPRPHRQDAEEQRIALHCYYSGRFVFILLCINQKKIKTKRPGLFHNGNVITTVFF
ncbi:hypothetical protein BVD23_10240 [Salmonella enterica]|nr:hypothetical protein [Salmonella enterica]ECJ5919080.1 hypothetical protein [Salmonella enterica subsp. salamae]EAN4946118.1 hypothetical protein [Salmonella enterica]EAX8454673.1 hypothetical protein [Salmonella enterica]EAX8551988.1 hypothetical protein [Salmonella enterica]